MSHCKVTVFTPTYNRGYIIPNLYESLKKQTKMDFEWLVVDDGSNDKTEEFFKRLENINHPFNITYLKTKNGGKHRAINKGLDLANGELFFIVDSDDMLRENAIEKIIQWESTIKSYHGKFVGVAGNKGNFNNQIIGSTFDGDFVDATNLERYKYNICGDKAEVLYTRILKEFKFPEFTNENFITEAVVWNRIAHAGYKIRWFNENIYLCDYLDDGLTKKGMSIFSDNPKGYALYINQEIYFHNKGLKEKMSLWVQYYYNTCNKLTSQEISSNLGISIYTLKITLLLWNLRRKLNANR